MFVHWVVQLVHNEWSEEHRTLDPPMFLPARLLLDEQDRESHISLDTPRHVLRLVMRAWMGDLGDGLFDAFYLRFGAVTQWPWAQPDPASAAASSTGALGSEEPVQVESGALPSPYRPLLDRTVEEWLLHVQAPLSTAAASATLARNTVTDQLVLNHIAFREGEEAAAPAAIDAYNKEHKVSQGKLPLPALDQARFHLLVTHPGEVEAPPAGTSHVDWKNPDERDLYMSQLLRYDSAFWTDIRLRQRRCQIFDKDLDPSDLHPAPTSKLYSGDFSISNFKFNPVSELPDPKETPLFGKLIKFIEKGLAQIHPDNNTRQLLLYGPPGCGKTTAASWSGSRPHPRRPRTL